MNENIENLRKLANAAEREIIYTLREYGAKASETVKIGAYGAPSSLVDIRAENKIIEIVKNESMPYNIFSEEAGFINMNYEDTLIVDPLDGSYNAENNIPFYAVSLAVSGGALEGVKYALVRDVSHGVEYWAIKGEGAYRGNARLQADGHRNLYVIYLGKKAHPQSFDIARKARRVRSFGSASLELCAVAEGIADLFMYRFINGGALRIVDIAAGYLIVKEAGGLVLDETLSPLNMALDFKERKNVIAVANREILEVFK